MSVSRRHVPVLIVGSGVAGCTAALSIADKGIDVLLLNAGDNLSDGNSALAQGGIIYKAISDDILNDAKALEDDITIAGHGYNNVLAVRQLCEQGPICVENILIENAKIPFDRNDDGSFNLTREGGHRSKRILHCADYTGRAIMDGLSMLVKIHPRIKCLHNHSVIDLLTTHHHARKSQLRYEINNRCLGAYVLDDNSGEAETIIADCTVLATGGVGQIFLHTTNSQGCVGSSVAMATRAGVTLENLEYMQFHPTALFEERSTRRCLITESMRGEGARLLDGHGNMFMQKYDQRGDLAPRDIVAQAMMEEMLTSGEACLYLDASKIEADLPVRFPTVFGNCERIGIDIRKDPIPVVPAAHYFCGGVLADLNGRTSLNGLYAIGECACTGLHGANRLASTSLLEALVWGELCGQDIAKYINSMEIPSDLISSIPDWLHEGDEHNDDPALVAQDWANIRNTMWNYVGISRSSARLKRAFVDMRDLVSHIYDFYKRTRISKRLVDLFHGVHTAYVITQAAMRNTVSAGCHYRVD